MTSTKTSHPIPSYAAAISEIRKRGEWDARLVTRYEGRARKKDYAQAMDMIKKLYTEQEIIVNILMITKASMSIDHTKT